MKVHLPVSKLVTGASVKRQDGISMLVWSFRQSAYEWALSVHIYLTTRTSLFPTVILGTLQGKGHFGTCTAFSELHSCHYLSLWDCDGSKRIPFAQSCQVLGSFDAFPRPVERFSFYRVVLGLMDPSMYLLMCFLPRFLASTRTLSSRMFINYTSRLIDFGTLEISVCSI